MHIALAPTRARSSWTRGFRTRLLGAAAVLACAAGPALAQDAAGNGELEEVVVTAQHRSENLQSVPAAITALTSSAMEERDIRDLTGVARFAPGLTFERGSNANGGSISASVYMRGVGQRNAQPTADPAVGIYVDDVYFGRVVGAVLNVVDAERVEVLRGPQGTLYGKNTLGGAINIVSKQPASQFGGYIDVAAGNHEERNLRAAVDLPLVGEQLAARLSITSLEHDGYDRNVVTGQRMGSLDVLAGRLNVRWTPSDNFRASFFADSTTERDTAQAIHPAVITAASVLDPIYADGTRKAFGAGTLLNKASNDLDAWGVAAHLAWDVAPNVTLTSITGYRKMQSHVGVDVDGTPLIYNENEIYDTQDQTSQEFRLNGTAWNDRLKWQLGVFYAEEGVSDLNFIHRRIVAGLPESFLTIRQEIKGKNETWAVFTQETVQLSDKLSLTGGIRYSHEEKAETVQSTPTPPFSFVTGFPPTDLSDTWNSTTLRFSLDYKPVESVLAYVSYAEGFKSGGFTYVTVFQTDLSTYDPETTETWELGLKADLLDRRLRVNAAAFHTKYKDLQFESFFAPGVVCPTFCSRTLNAAAAEIQGLELEITAAPVRGLDLFANLAYMDNKVTKVDVRALSQVNRNSVLPRTPDWTVTLGGSYSFPVGAAGEAKIRADYNFRSRSYFDFSNQPSASQDDFGLLNVGASFETADKRWVFAVNVQNLTDKLYASSGTGTTFNSDGYTFVSYGAPRTVTASLRYRFGAE